MNIIILITLIHIANYITLLIFFEGPHKKQQLMRLSLLNAHLYLVISLKIQPIRSITVWKVPPSSTAASHRIYLSVVSDVFL